MCGETYTSQRIDFVDSEWVPDGLGKFNPVNISENEHFTFAEARLSCYNLVHSGGDSSGSNGAPLIRIQILVQKG